MKTGLSSFTVVPLHPALKPININPTTSIDARTFPVRNSGIKIDDVGKREAKEFTLRGSLSGADWISSNGQAGRTEEAVRDRRRIIRLLWKFNQGRNCRRKPKLPHDLQRQNLPKVSPPCQARRNQPSVCRIQEAAIPRRGLNATYFANSAELGTTRLLYPSLPASFATSELLQAASR